MLKNTHNICLLYITRVKIKQQMCVQQWRGYWTPICVHAFISHFHKGYGTHACLGKNYECSEWQGSTTIYSHAHITFCCQHIMNKMSHIFTRLLHHKLTMKFLSLTSKFIEIGGLEACFCLAVSVVGSSSMLAVSWVSLMPCIFLNLDTVEL